MIARFKYINLLLDLKFAEELRLPPILPIHEDIIKRLIQEEIWSQTEWPEGEVPLDILLKE